MLDVDPTAQQWLAQHGYSSLYGARAIARIVRTDLLFPLARKLLQGAIRFVSVYHRCYSFVTQVYYRDGDTVRVTVADDGKSLQIPDLHSPDGPSSKLPPVEVNESENT